jgi:hypothetical protein
MPGALHSSAVADFACGYVISTSNYTWQSIKFGWRKILRLYGGSPTTSYYSSCRASLLSTFVAHLSHRLRNVDSESIGVPRTRLLGQKTMFSLRDLNPRVLLHWCLKPTP